MKGYRSALFAILLLVGSALLPSQSAGAQVNPPQRHYRPVCGSPSPHFASCHADVVTDDAGRPLGLSVPISSSMGPAQFHTAYNLPCAPSGGVQSICAQPVQFGPQTIAIVDAYHDPSTESDLNVYSSYYGIPACTQGNGCLTILNENGGTTLPTTTNGSWALETSLDVQVAHTVCQTCKLVLLEANTNSWADLTAAENTAARLGVTAISNSYGGSEWSSESSYDSAYNHPGIAVVASSGDTGNTVEYPAASPYVVAVGGTTLHLNSNGTYAGESVWSSAGSGCSAYEPANSWQTGVSDWSQTGCAGKVGSASVAADADPNTGAAVYDSFGQSGNTYWTMVGGTSLAAPIIASVFALAGGVPAGVNAQSVPYANFSPADSHDVTTGSNGACGTIMCTAAGGYDGPTGLGTPNGVGGFGGASNAPPPTATPTSPLPTATSTSPPPTATSTPTSGPTSTPAPTPTCVPNKRSRCR